MNRDEVLNRLCAVVTKVGVSVFDSTCPHDCFCPSGEMLSRASIRFHSVDEEIVRFIEDAIDEKIAFENRG